MDLATIIGLTLGFGAVIGSVILEGGNPLDLVNGPAAVIVFGGTFGVAFVNFPLGVMVSFHKFFMKALFEKAHDPKHVVEEFVKLADKARKEGLLALEQEARSLEPFAQKGMLLVVDGSDPQMVRDVLEADVDAMKKRHHAGIALFEALGGFAPTLGIIGTVMGLVNVLGHLENPDELGHLIAGAFVATLYGVSSANLIYLPIAGKLKLKSHHEAELKELTVEGVMSVQAGDNPRMVREKLEAYLSPAMRSSGKGGAEGAAKAA